ARVEVDLDLARRVVGNLIHNAIEFSPEGATVTIALGTRGDEWTCAVSDQGPPLPAEDLARVFEGFYRARRQLPDGRPSHEGTRIGLAIARSIVRLHGGRMWADHPDAGGARFTIALPIRQLASTRARRIARQTVGREDLKRLFDAIVDLVAASLEAGIV